MATSVLRRTAAQLFMVGIPGPRLDRETRAFLNEYRPGGIVLFRRNVRSARQLRALIAELHEYGAGVPPLVAIDHEGGRVHRLGRPFTHFPPMAAVGRSRSTALATAVGRAMGCELAALGLDLDFAPVLDVWSNPRNRVIGDRAFGPSPALVARLGSAFGCGLERGGVLSCGKHFPGHGASVGDSHLVLPRVRASRRILAGRDLVPFKRAIRAGIPALMTAHVVFPALDRRPATLSHRICTTLLRRGLGFRGVLFSDDLEMNAVAAHLPPARIAVAALQAGCDMLLVCQSLRVARSALAGVEDAIARGRLTSARLGEALARIHTLRHRRAHLPPPRLQLGWPAHTRLARRVAVYVGSTPPRTSRRSAPTYGG